MKFFRYGLTSGVALICGGCGGGSSVSREGKLEIGGPQGFLNRKVTGLDLYSMVHEKRPTCDSLGSQRSVCTVELEVPEAMKNLLIEFSNVMSKDMEEIESKLAYSYRKIRYFEGFFQKIFIQKPSKKCFELMHISSYDKAPLTTGFGWLKHLKVFLASMPGKSLGDEFDKIPWGQRVVKSNDEDFLAYAGDTDTTIRPNLIWEITRCRGEADQFKGIVKYFENFEKNHELEKVLGF